MTTGGIITVSLLIIWALYLFRHARWYEKIAVCATVFALHFAMNWLFDHDFGPVIVALYIIVMIVWGVQLLIQKPNRGKMEDTTDSREQ